jgi:hypothetical protein
MISRDVIFDEKHPWNWGEQGSRQAPSSTFSIDGYADTVHHPATDGVLPDGPIFSGAPASPEATIPLDDDGNGGHSTPPHTPISGGLGSTPSATTVQWATPPTDASEDSDGGPRRYRTITNLLDTTDEIHDMEYSGLCLVAAEEPGSVEEALKEECWRQAMQAEMQAIESNRTWDVSDLPA